MLVFGLAYSYGRHAAWCRCCILRLVCVMETANVVCEVGTQFLGAFAKLQKVTISFIMSVRLSVWNNSTPTGRILRIC
jgi:hypothetical protein